MKTASSEQQPCRDPQEDFYIRSLELMQGAGIPFLIGGAYALKHYTGIYRDTKDLDIFIRGNDRQRTLDLFSEAGFETSITFSHWLAKAVCGGHLVDIIFSSGNAISEVDDSWFEYSQPGRVFGIEIKLVPPEEMIWSKGYIMERERFDGADINHLLLNCSQRLDWKRLLERFGPHWRILFSHVLVFGFVYPSERNMIPRWVIRELTSRLEEEAGEDAPVDRICQGTLISRQQYWIDINERGFADGRLIPNGNMTRKQAQKWDAGAQIDGSYSREN